MIKLSEDGKFVTVSAFNAATGMDPSVALQELRAAFPLVEVQFFDGARVAGTQHLEIAAINAARAFKTGINISRSLAMETLLYASAQRQIEVAIDRLGVRRESRTIGLVVFSNSKDEAQALENRIAHFLKTDLNDALLDDWSEKKTSQIVTLYGIETVELESIRRPGREPKEAVSKAVLERVALLSTRT